MADQADFSGAKSVGAKGSESRNGLGLARTAKSPSPRSAKSSGEKRPRGQGGAISPSASQNRKKTKGNQSWGSLASSANSDPSPILQSNTTKNSDAAEKTIPESKPTGFRIKKINVDVSIDTPQGIMAKSDAAKARVKAAAKAAPPTPRAERTVSKSNEEKNSINNTVNNNTPNADNDKVLNAEGHQDSAGVPEETQSQDNESNVSGKTNSKN
eukprot:586851-Pleurochrysis_carterae.AAC.1